METSVLTPAFTLVPSNFFEPSGARDILAGVADLKDSDRVSFVEVPAYSAVLVYAAASGQNMSDNISGGEGSLPEMYYILRDLPRCTEYNKILCSWKAGYLYISIAQGRTLLLSNAYPSEDFTTAEYYIFLAMKSLQLNPEVSTICWRHAIDSKDEMSLYRYFKSVDRI